MTLLNWDIRYSINNEEFDKQHKELFRIVNRLHDINVGNDIVNTYETTIAELASYADYHMKAEEQYMRDIGYKDIDKHIAEHEYFRQRIIDLKQGNIKDDLEQRHELIVFLGGWMLRHEIEEDKKIAL
jgi:hemerythrin